jgi:hypothetical protein
MIITTPSPSQVLRLLFIAVLCVVFGLWGMYDLWVKIPRREQLVQRFEAASQTLKDLEAVRQKHQQSGTRPIQSEIDAYNAANAELKALTPGGEAPVAPSKFDRVVQWVYIACLPCALWPLMGLFKIRRQKYRLDESGALAFEGDPEHGNGSWAANEIADIDMSRWMAKSIAWVVGPSGKRLKLDAYLFKNLDRIVAAIACRLHPDSWDGDARPIKSGAEAKPGVQGAVSSPQA